MSKSSTAETKASTSDAILQALSDRATDTGQYDHLNFARYADALAFLIDQKSVSTPLIIAISAPWGAGKTTLANLVQEQLQEKVAWDEAHIICRFNAWKHDDAPNLGAAFAAEVAQRANEYRRWWRRLIKPLPSPMLTPQQRWRRRLWTIIVSVIIVTVIVLGRKTRDAIFVAMQPSQKGWHQVAHYVHGYASVAVVIAAVFIFLFPKIYSGMRGLARFVDDPGAEAARGSIDSVRKELGKLIRSATRGQRRFVIFVDDLERCRPPRAVEVCEVASQLLDHDGVVTVLVADMESIARSAAIKYRDLEILEQGKPDTGSYDRYGRAYLQKLVQIQFNLPPAASDQLKNMLRAEHPRPEKKKKKYKAIGARIWKFLSSRETLRTITLVIAVAAVFFEYAIFTNKTILAKAYTAYAGLTYILFFLLLF